MFVYTTCFVFGHVSRLSGTWQPTLKAMWCPGKEIRLFLKTKKQKMEMEKVE